MVHFGSHTRDHARARHVIKDDRPEREPSPDDRRRDSDRRARPTPMLGLFTFRGRRRWIRRDDERRGGYVDRPGPWMLGMMAVVLALSILDAVFTLAHLDRGGREINPLMDWAIGIGPLAFLAIKCFLTGSGMLLLVLHRFFAGVKIMLAAVLSLYSLLMVYHLVLAVL